MSSPRPLIERPKQIVTPQDAGYPVLPCHVDASGILWDAFCDAQTCTAATLIVRFCQERGHWGVFSGSEICEFYRHYLAETLPDTDSECLNRANFFFGYLTQDGEDGFVIAEPGKQFRIAHDFVTRCWANHPSLPKGKGRTRP
jgi:hypothetical protein